MYSFTITGSDGVSADATSFDITVNNSKLIPSSIAINGQVNTFEKVGDILYIGGYFKSVGYNVGAGVILKNATCTGAACISDNILNLDQMPKIVGEVHECE